MSKDGSTIVVTDTSVLVNFLAVDRMDLIASHPCRFVVTEHVIGEIQEHYQERYERFVSAMSDGTLSTLVVSSPDELETFGRLSLMGRLGLGECSAIAAAVHQGYALAIDDKRAAKLARQTSSNLRIVGTPELMVEMIRAGLISIEEADCLKEEWAREHRFVIKTTSFSEML